MTYFSQVQIVATISTFKIYTSTSHEYKLAQDWDKQYLCVNDIDLSEVVERPGAERDISLATISASTLSHDFLKSILERGTHH